MKFVNRYKINIDDGIFKRTMIVSFAIQAMGYVFTCMLYHKGLHVPVPYVVSWFVSLIITASFAFRYNSERREQALFVLLMPTNYILPFLTWLAYFLEALHKIHS